MRDRRPPWPLLALALLAVRLEDAGVAAMPTGDGAHTPVVEVPLDEHSGFDCGGFHGMHGHVCSEGEHQSPIDVHSGLAEPTSMHAAELTMHYPQFVTVSFDVEAIPGGRWNVEPPHDAFVSLRGIKYHLVQARAVFPFTSPRARASRPPLASHGKTPCAARRTRWEPCLLACLSARAACVRAMRAQFHAHSPSEHMLNGVRYPAEVHLVHMNRATCEMQIPGFTGACPNVVVVSVLFSGGSERTTNSSWLGARAPAAARPLVRPLQRCPICSALALLCPIPSRCITAPRACAGVRGHGAQNISRRRVVRVLCTRWT